MAELAKINIKNAIGQMHVKRNVVYIYAHMLNTPKHMVPRTRSAASMTLCEVLSERSRRTTA